VKWRQNRPLWHNQPGQIFAVSGRMILDEALIDAVLTRLDAYRAVLAPTLEK
jgi:hypothetical protein